MFPRVNSVILVHRPRETRTPTHKQLGQCCARCSCPQVWTKQEGVLWQEGTMLSAQLALQAMLRVPLLGHVALTNPTPSRHVPLLTSVKKPAIPAWHEPCSSPYFFLYSGGEKGRKKKPVVIPGTAHALPACIATQPGEISARRGFYRWINHHCAPWQHPHPHQG